METTSLGRYIQDWRAARGVTQGALADQAGIARPHLSQIESGKIALPNADLRRRLAAALGLTHIGLLVIAGELSEDEAGPQAPPPFPPDDPRAQIVDLVRPLTMAQAEQVRVIVAGAVRLTRRIEQADRELVR